MFDPQRAPDNDDGPEEFDPRDDPSEGFGYWPGEDTPPRRTRHRPGHIHPGATAKSWCHYPDAPYPTRD